MIIADLHIHSKYSRATSRECVPEFLDLWARRKGIHLVGTGDFTHPAWRAELREKLVPAEEGLYRLKEDLRQQDAIQGPVPAPRFVVTGEVSSIYKKNGKVRKVHNLILLPHLEAAEVLSQKLEAIGNIHSDGRPILGLDSRDLLEITLETCPEAILIPAHIWTPHFSLFGAFSGFDTIEECFEDLTPHIHALETGLSSDPPMNWSVSALDKYTLVSNSDAHSPQKLGREANLLQIDLSYGALKTAIETREGFYGTIEFFPEEGKYHYDGHRNCKVCLTPAETLAYEGKCPVCGKKLTIGVEHRVEQLADRPKGVRRPNALPFESLAPLSEVISASTGFSAAGVKTAAIYERMLRELGPEFYILREAPLEQIERAAGPGIAEGIRRLRQGNVTRIPGYDGAYGVIQILDEAERQQYEGQMSLFLAEKKQSGKKAAPPKAPRRAAKQSRAKAPAEPEQQPNEAQQQAVESKDKCIAVLAGPGTGKTKTLVSRIVHLVEQEGVKPKEIAAITFTNQAAGALRQRLEQALGKRRVGHMEIGTFHSVCLKLLEKWEQPVTLLDEYDALDLAGEAMEACGCRGSVKSFLQDVSRIKNGVTLTLESKREAAVLHYGQMLSNLGVMDFDDLLLCTLHRLNAQKAGGKQRIFAHVLVDEFQDLNPVQYQLVQAFSEESDNLFVIGDPDQAIYGFRGASAQCFAWLLADHPQMQIIRLTQNYRSTPQILRCALCAIAGNGGERRKLDAYRDSGSRVRLLTAESALAEAVFVAKEIGRLVGGMDMLEAQAGSLAAEERRTYQFSDIAVLYRTHRQAKRIEQCLAAEGIPYVVRGKEDFLAQGLVRGCVNFFRFLLEPQEHLALSSCLKQLWNCPSEAVYKAEAAFTAQAEQLDTEIKWRAAFSVLEGEPKLASFVQTARDLLPDVEKAAPQILLAQLREKAELPETPSLDQLMQMAILYADMPSFLQTLRLGEEGDFVRSGGKTYSSSAVTLMTLHGAKGLEYPAVFLCGVSKGQLPLEHGGQTADLEEERRLFYVGITRAKEELVLLTSQESPSPFVAELQDAQMETGSVTRARPVSEGTQLCLF